MDSVFDTFMTFLDFLSFGYLDFQWRDRNLSGFIKYVFHLCFVDYPKSDGLEQHEYRKQTEFSFLGFLFLKTIP